MVTAVFSLLCVGCPEVDNPYREPPKPDLATFVDKVQPILSRDCSFLGCHGSQDRTLTLYAVGFLRAPAAIPGTPLTENELSEAELDWNYEAIRLRLIDATSADDSLLLRKCLPLDLGGSKHADGVVVFKSRSDPAYKTLRDWIDGGLK